MKKETFDTAFALTARITNVSAAWKRLLEGGDEPYEIKLTGLPDTDRKEIRALVMDYLRREEDRAQSSFDAL